MSDHLFRRGGLWVYRRRVPKEFAEVDPRKFVKQSTKILIRDDPRGAKAQVAAEKINAEVEAYWVALIAGNAEEARARYSMAQKRARTLGFNYEPVATIAGLPAAEIISRLDKIEQLKADANEPVVSALLGGVPAPTILLSDLYEEFEKLELANIRDMSSDQKRLWKNPKVRAIKNLIGVVGDKAITSLRRSTDALDFRNWWQDRILDEDMHPDTANKDLQHIQKMLTTVENAKKIGAQPCFNNLRFSAPDDEEKFPFDPDFIQKRILAAGALSGLNEEARAVIYIMTETGMRPSEIVNLTEATILLNHQVPHVRALPDGRRMKTPHSRREIPLVGVALIAARRHPNGFPRYRDKASGLSATINKFLGDNGLRQTDDHTLYSLRHSFEDRLIEVDAPDKMIAGLMGHKHSRPRYGKGPTLENKRKWLRKIAFKPPARV